MRPDLQEHLRSYAEALEEMYGSVSLEDILDRSGDVQRVPARITFPARPQRNFAVVFAAVLIAAAMVVIAILSDDSPVVEPPTTTIITPIESPANGVIIRLWGEHTVVPPGARPMGLDRLYALPFDLQQLAFPSIAWAPNGVLLAVIGDDGLLRVVDAFDARFDGAPERVTQRFQCPCQLDWSPDGTTIVIAPLDGDPRLVNTATWQVSTLSFPDSEAVGFPTWSPDSRWIAFLMRTGTETSQIVKVRRDGSGLTMLAEGLVGTPDWSPKGDQIALLALDDLLTSDRTLELWMIDSEGGGAEKVRDVGRCACLGFSPGLSWSPDGTLIAVNTLDPDGIFLMKPDGTDSRRIADQGRGDPAWQPVPGE